ncbi:GDSL-type esterase/lipase family protein [Rosistilla oblonga]|uniref:GDSL-type esterase/lipase family protein n=1 Tax=Rosistilla oblonga TaxID=2527990 RepID=UPI003A97EFB0
MKSPAQSIHSPLGVFEVILSPRRIVVLATLFVVGGISVAEAQQKESRWEKTIAGFEAVDAKNPPEPGGIVFTGSSSVRMWDLKKSFPELQLVNRGFGGSEIADSTEFASRFLIPHKPRQIVLYAGDNDIAKGKDAAAVIEDFQQFVNTISTALPETKIAFLAIKPSISRWKLWPTMKAANDGIAAICEADPKLDFIDISPDMFGDDGKPDPALFAKDGLHMTPAGYERWTARVRKTLGW